MRLTPTQRLFLFATWLMAFPVRWLGWAMTGLGLAVLLHLMLVDSDFVQRALWGLIFFQDFTLMPPISLLFFGWFFDFAGSIFREAFHS